MTTHALYRFFSSDGDLLYVGITNDPGRRWPEHASGKPWWHEVDRIGIERHPDRSSVLLAEKTAIVTERPRYNLAGALAASRRDAVPARSRAYRCPACGTASRYDDGRDLFLHEDGSANRRCRRLVHAGRTPFAGPRGEALRVSNR